MSPLASLGALLALVAFSVSAWGWGRAALRACGVEAKSGAAYPAVVGLAALAAAGGWLNVLSIAYPPLLWALLAIGWLAAVHALAQARCPARLVLHLDVIIPAVAIALFAELLALTLLPSASFNTVDDFQLYFPRPVRMLQVGTLGGNPFEPLGLDSLGTHAFLQAFTLLVLPLEFLNAFDAVLCLVLALTVVASLGRALGLGVAAGLASLAALVLVPPLQVNISPVYATSAFLLALAPAAARLLEAGSASGAEAWRRALPAGLLLAAVLGAKLTTATFVMPAVVVFCAGLGLWRGWRAALAHAARIGAWTALFLLPWLALHAGKFAQWMGARGESFGVVGSTADLLTENLKLGWGGTVMQFNGAALLALAAGLAGAFVLLRGAPESALNRALPLLALCAGGACAYVLNTLPYDINHAVRYSAPALIAGVPAAVLLVAALAPRLAVPVLAIAMAASVGVLFTDTTSERVRRAVEYSTPFSYPAAALPGFSMLTAWGLDPDVRAWVRKAQSATAPGERTLALIACPYHLLFARNPVLTASEFGVSAPWLGPPPVDAAGMRAYLARDGVRYVIWQIGAGAKTDEQLIEQARGAYPVERRLALNLLSFRRALADLTRADGAIYADDGLIVVDLGRTRR